MAAGVCVIFSGCSKKPAPAPVTPPATPKSSTTATGGAATNAAPVQVAGIPKSIFVIDPSIGRDPFFPDTRKTLVEPASSNKVDKPAGPVNVAASLRVQGILTPTIALVNATMVEKGREATITVKDASGQESKVKVKCLNIDTVRGTVILSVPGSPAPVELRLVR